MDVGVTARDGEGVDGCVGVGGKGWGRLWMDVLVLAARDGGGYGWMRWRWRHDGVFVDECVGVTARDGEVVGGCVGVGGMMGLLCMLSWCGCEDGVFVEE